MMIKLYNKNAENFALVWIGIYVVLCILADNVSGSIGIQKVITAPFCFVFAMVLFFFIRKYDLCETVGLCRFQGDVKRYLFFIPLALLCTTNVWWGVRLNVSIGETILYVISMLFVGFIEEIIFRGFLFTAMCKRNVKVAMLVSSATFGLGHIVNLLNGRELIATLSQVCYAMAIGYVFTVVFYKGKSLWPCIITHSVINCLSVISNSGDLSEAEKMIPRVFLCVVSLAYAWYLVKVEKGNSNEEEAKSDCV